jgi:superfamily II DNA or RNA helicase
MLRAAVPIPDSATRLVTSCFGAATTRAALALATADRVHLVRPLWPVVARVRDDESHVVTVHYDPAAIHLRGDCSCDVAVDCAHAAATALVALAQEASNHAGRARAAAEASVGDWLTGLGLIERERAEPPAADRIVAYVLDLREGEVGLTPLAATRLQRGGLGAGQPIAALADPMRGAPRWVDVADLRRIAMLRAVSRAPAETPRLRVDRIHGELLRELADAGVLFWESTRGDPLRWGAPVTDALRWCPAGAAGDDSYRLGIDSELVIVPARECHYVDPATATLGPLDLGLSSEVVDKLIHGPAVPASMRATVDRSLRPFVGDARAPDDTLPMQPRLHAWLDHEDPALRHAVQLRCEAVYGDEPVPLAVWDAARTLARDLVAEGRARARLDALLERLPHGVRAATSRELLADARHLAHVIVPALRAEGWECTLADDFPHEAPVADVTFTERLEPMADEHGWFRVELGVTVGGRTVPLLPILLQAIRDGLITIAAGGVTVAGGGGLNLTLPEGELVHVPAERVARWLRPLVELELYRLDADGALVVPPAVAVAIDDGAPGRFARAGALDAVRAGLDALLANAPRAAGAEFTGTLRPYQEHGHAWLRALHDAGCGGLLADEMGLGKTVQVLAFLDGLRTDGVLTAAAPALVVAPRSVVGNWHAEAARFAPRIAAQVHLGSDRPDAPADVTRTPLVITSYQTLARDVALLGSIRWTTVILDEAQQVKNPDTQLRAAAAALDAHSRFTITGTPVENHLGDLWSQMDLAMPGLLGRRASFDALFRRPVEKFAAAVPLEGLRQRIRPFLLRRTKAQVELDLPPKTEIVERIELEPAQRDLYESLRLTLDTQVRAALAARGIQGSSMTILDALLKLRQCCCDPRLVPLPQARKVRTSSKLERLLVMLEELADAGRSTLVFSQFASMLRLIADSCARAGIPTLSLTGATRDRDTVVRRFQAGESPVMLVSLKAGGVGLNLTRADTVIHYDPWWNPAAEAQATDRAHRIGQDRPVMVYKLVARGTLEETILDLQDEKRALMSAALSRDGAAITGAHGLTATDLHALYKSA